MYYMTAHAGLIVCYQKRLFSESFCVKPSSVLFGDGHMTWSTVWFVFLWSKNCLPFHHFVTAYFWGRLSTLFVKNVEFWYNLWKYFAGRSAGSAAGRGVKTSSSNRTIGSPSSASSGSNISSAGSSRGGGWVLSYFYVEGGVTLLFIST